jgi:hypothetical protein
MAYIGKTPTVGNFQVCDAISVVNNQAAYTMQVGSVNVLPETANHMIVSLNGTIQKPNSSFTVSGSTITFSSNLATGDVIDFIQILGDVLDLGVPSDNTVTTAKVVDGAITSAKLASGAGFNPDGAVVFNESGADVDFRVESNNDANCLFVDGGSDSIGVGTGVPDVATYFGKVINMKGASAGIMFDRNGNQKYSVGVTTGGRLDFALGAAQQMSLMDSGDFYVGATSGSIGNAGFKTFGTSTSNKSGINIVVEGGNVPLSTNRLTSDGTLINFYQATSLEGTISVSGSTVSYNGFTGTHWSRFIDNSTPTILRGTVLETLDQMCDWYNLEFDVTQNEQTWKEKIPHVLLDSQSNGDTVTYNHEGTDYQATIVKETDVKHMMSKVSDTTDAKNVYGVFSAYDLDGEGYNDFYVASVGSYVVRIKSGQTIAKGDLLQSNGDGTAKVQLDDNIKSSSFAKVLSTTVIETYEDGSFIVPCSLMC